MSSWRGPLIAGSALALLLLATALWWTQRGAAPLPQGGADHSTAARAADHRQHSDTPVVPASQATALRPPASATDPRAEVIAQFDQVVGAQTPGWGVAVALDSKRLRMDHDKLVFSLRSQQDGFVYVFYLGADGQLQQLFPNGVSPPPRAVKGSNLKLPQGRLDLNVAGPPGPSALLVMVSRWPRDHGAAMPREENGFRSFPVGAEAARLAQRAALLPGGLPLIGGQAVCTGAAPCSDEFAAARVSFDVVP